MVTMLPSYWHSVAIFLVFIVSSNFSSVTSYCSDRSNLCEAGNHLDRVERQLLFKDRQERGNELDRSFRDSLRRESTDRTHSLESVKREDLRSNRLSSREPRIISSKERNSRVVSREDRSPYYILDKQPQAVARRLRHFENRNNLRFVDSRNEIARKSFDVLREERKREQRVRVDKDEKDRVFDQRIREDRERVEYEQIREDRVRIDRIRREERFSDRRNREDEVRKIVMILDLPIRRERVRDDRFRNEEDRQKRVLDRRVSGIRVQLVREASINENRIRKEADREAIVVDRRIHIIREELANEDRTQKQAHREERVVNKRVRMERVRIGNERISRNWIRIEEDGYIVRERRTRDERVSVQRDRTETRLLHRTREETTRPDRKRDALIHDEYDREERAPDQRTYEKRLGVELQKATIRSNWEEVTRRQNSDDRNRVDNTNIVRADRKLERIIQSRNNENRININTRRERMSERQENRRYSEGELRTLNDRREYSFDRQGNQRRETLSKQRNDRKEEVAKRQISGAAEERLLATLNTVNPTDSSKIDSGREINSKRDVSAARDFSLRRQIRNHNEEQLNRHNDNFILSHNENSRMTSLKETNRLNSPQLTWNLCHVLLFGAIALQLLKYKDEISESKSAFMNYFPLMSPSHIKVQ